MRGVRDMAMALTGLAGMLASPASADTVDALAWLSGAWTGAQGGGWVEEHWTAPRGGIMLGTNRSGAGDRATGFEFMRIAVDGDGAIHFWGAPGGKPAVPFRLTGSAPGEAVFENPDHDFPTRIVYRREGEMLVATVSGPGGKDAQSWRFARPRR